MNTLHCQGPHKPSSFATFTLISHWLRVATMRGGGWILCLCAQGRFDPVWLCNPVNCGLPGFSVMGFSRQEYWGILANTGCHTFLEHYIPFCPSRQLPWVPSAAETPVTAAPPPHLALTGANPSLPGQCSLRSKPQGTTHMQRWE